MSNNTICNCCNSLFADLDVPIKCDGCALLFHPKCSGLSASELKCLGLKNRLLKFFCSDCEKGLKELPELKSLLNKLLVEVENLKSNLGNNPNLSNEFIINEINERNKRAKNVIFYNIQESNSNQTGERLSYDNKQVNSTIASILVDTDNLPTPLKVIRLGRYQPGKLRPIKAIFESDSIVFDIIRNKNKLTHSNPPSTVYISTDRTPYQRDYMKSLKEELMTRTKNGEAGLTIKFIKGTPKIVIANIASNTLNNSHNFR